MNTPETNLFFILIVLLNLGHLQTTFADATSFDFPSFTFRNITLLGDSYLRNGVIGLTRELGVPSSSSGKVLYDSPIRFFDPQTNASASFSSRFSFSITNLNPGSYGDGLAFFISPDNQTLGSSGGFLGLVNSSTDPSNNKIIAVEFDTFLDTQFNDPNSNHIGLDINNLSSVKTIDAGLAGIDLKSGNLITTWIEYKDSLKKLLIWVSYSNFKPDKPVMSVKIDLSKHFEEFMYVGFSGSTEGSTELHMLEEWSFRTFGFSYRSLFPAHNKSSSPIPWITTPDIPVSNSSRCNRHPCWSRKLSLSLEIIGLITLCLITVVSCWFFTNKWRTFLSQKNFNPDLVKGPRKFSYRELSSATKRFHYSRVIGRGSYGTVYKGVLGSGITVAVKRSKCANQGKSEFVSELSIIACLRHRNLVPLQGWCDEKGELLLVYEFMVNGSLDGLLYEEEGTKLNWAQRYNIATGVASVLTYLHQECEQQVIHRDIKTSNIMLDGNFNPRLGDFGLAKITEHDKSPDSTLTAGTMGYLAPEYLQYGKATEKTDVFSFGVVMLELACGRRPIEKDTNQKMFNLIDWVWGFYSRDKLIEAADSRLNGEFDVEEMERILLVGLSCANPDYTERPSMRKVIQILNGEATVPVVPRSRPTLIFSNSLPLSLQEIVSDCEQSVISSPLYELNIQN